MFDRQAGTGDAGSLTAKWAVKTISFETACLTWNGGELEHKKVRVLVSPRHWDTPTSTR